MGGRGRARQDRPDRRREGPARPKTQGFPVWTEEDVAAYEARWPIGTKERVWLDVLLYTGLRRGDAVRLGRQHVRDGVATLRTEKSQEQVTVTIPILPVLAATLDAGPTGELAFICGENRRATCQGVVRQRFQRGRSSGRRAQVGAWCAEDRRHQGGRERRDRGRARGDLRLAGRRDGCALHARG
jgi:integrase